MLRVFVLVCGANCVGPVLLDWLLVLHWCSKALALHARLVMSIVCVCVCLSAGVDVLLQPLSFYGFHLPQCHPQPGPAPWHHMEATLSSSHCAIPCCSYGSCFFYVRVFLIGLGLLTVLSCNGALVAGAKNDNKR